MSRLLIAMLLIITPFGKADSASLHLSVDTFERTTGRGYTQINADEFILQKKCHKIFFVPFVEYKMSKNLWPDTYF